MTTIAYKDGVIAYDSQCTRDHVVISTTDNKKHETEKYIYFCAGALDEIVQFIDFHENGTKYFQVIGVNSFIVDKETNKVFYSGVANESTPLGEPDLRLWKHEINYDELNAIGSGWEIAFTAMDLGMSAEEAVIYTATKDIYTGGKINTFSVNTKQYKCQK